MTIEFAFSFHFIRIGPFKTVRSAEAESYSAILALTILRILRETMGHIDLAHFDAVLQGVAR